MGWPSIREPSYYATCYVCFVVQGISTKYTLFMYICCFSDQNSWKPFAKDSHACTVLPFFPISLAEMFPLVNTGVAGMTYLSSKRLMVGVPGRHHSCSSGSGALLGGWVLDLSWSEVRAHCRQCWYFSQRAGVIFHKFGKALTIYFFGHLFWFSTILPASTSTAKEKGAKGEGCISFNLQHYKSN